MTVLKSTLPSKRPAGTARITHDEVLRGAEPEATPPPPAAQVRDRPGRSPCKQPAPSGCDSLSGAAAHPPHPPHPSRLSAGVSLPWSPRQLPHVAACSRNCRSVPRWRGQQSGTRTCLRPTQGPRLLAADLRDRAGAPLRGRPLLLRTSSSGLGKAPRTRCSAEESGRTAQHRWVTVCVHSVCPCGRVRKEASGRKGTSRLLVRRCGQGNFR